MAMLLLIGTALAVLLMVAGPALFAALFGEPWREAGELSRALAPYIAMHFVASPLAVVTLAWKAQGWALRLALVGQVVFLAAVAIGLHFGGLQGAAWAVSAAMLPYFGFYFWSLARWPLPAPELNASANPT
jgi:O-antigen/teichoic acid export membrane protein